MDRLLKYATALWVLGAVTYVVVTLGFLRSIEAFKPVNLRVKAAEVASKTNPETQTEPTSNSAGSDLIGSRTRMSQFEAVSPSAVEAPPDNPIEKQSWVEVETDVNMRAGPSASNRIIAVQPHGTTLRVLSHEKNWMEVIEPDTGAHGWIFSGFVKELTSPTQQNAAVDAGER